MCVVDRLSFVSATISSIAVNDLILNPNVSIRSIVKDGQVVAYSVVTLIKGRGRLHHTLDIATTSPEVIDVLESLVEPAAEHDVAIDLDAWSSLASLGVLIQEDEVSAPVRFGCHLHGYRQLSGSTWTVNPNITVVAFADFVAGNTALAQVLQPCDAIALVADPVTGARSPYWLEDRDRTLLSRCTRGTSPPSDLRQLDASRFAHAGILINAEVVAAAHKRVSVARERLARDGYAELSQILPPAQIEALRCYYRDLVDEGHVASCDSQVPLRSARHNEPVMQYYHRQLREFFSCIVGQQVKPSYAYFASYRRGAVLKKHVDREQCKFTASVLIDYVAAPSDDQVWPLSLELPATGEQIDVHLTPGSAVLYRGCELPHYRHELRGERSASFFLHYVDEAFAGRLD